MSENRHFSLGSAIITLSKTISLPSELISGSECLMLTIKYVNYKSGILPDKKDSEPSPAHITEVPLILSRFSSSFNRVRRDRPQLFPRDLRLLAARSQGQYRQRRAYCNYRKQIRPPVINFRCPGELVHPDCEFTSVLFVSQIW